MLVSETLVPGDPDDASIPRSAVPWPDIPVRVDASFVRALPEGLSLVEQEMLRNARVRPCPGMPLPDALVLLLARLHFMAGVDLHRIVDVSASLHYSDDPRLELRVSSACVELRQAAAPS